MKMIESLPIIKSDTFARFVDFGQLGFGCYLKF
jgi:hypothetical protein